MARRKKNPDQESHERLAQQELEAAEQALTRAEAHASKDHYGRALTDATLAASIASVAVAEAQHAGDIKLANVGGSLMRYAGNLLLVSVAGIERQAGDRAARSVREGPGELLAALETPGAMSNPTPRQPDVTPLFLIRTYSSSLLTGGDEIYLVINTAGEVMDAITTPGEDFGPLEEAGYGSLAILELDVAGAQYRKLRKLAKRLSEVTVTRPTFRPGRGGSGIARRYQGARPNPSKKRLMR